MFNRMRRIDTATKKLFQDVSKRRAWVIYQLNLKGRSLASVGRDAGVNRGAVYQALRTPYPRMERAIAEAIGIPVQVLFPERYAPDGTRRIRMGRPKKSTRKHVQHSNCKGKRNVRKERAA